MTKRLPDPCPSTLPETGLDLNVETQRYRGWLIEQALIHTQGNRTKAAELLHINRKTLSETVKRESSRPPPIGALVPASDAQRRAAIATLRSQGFAPAEIAIKLGLEREYVGDVLSTPAGPAKCEPR